MSHDLPRDDDFSSGWDDEIWDEHQWEAFMRASDRRSASYANLVYIFLSKYPRPLDSDPEAVQSWKDRLRAFLESKGWNEEHSMLPLLWIGDDGLEQDAPEDDFEEGLYEESFEDDISYLEALPVYREGMSLSLDVLGWANDLDLAHKDLVLVEFCSQVNQVPAKIAAGHGMGYEREALGGNIACVKRALRAANRALDLLAQLKSKPYLERATYLSFYERIHELRNGVGLYVQELRRRFELGID